MLAVISSACRGPWEPRHEGPKTSCSGQAGVFAVCPWTLWYLCSVVQPPMIWSACTRADARTHSLSPRDVSEEKSCPLPSRIRLNPITASPTEHPGREGSINSSDLSGAQDSRAAIQASTKNTVYEDHKRSFISGCGGNLYTSPGPDLSSSTSQSFSYYK